MLRALLRALLDPHRYVVVPVGYGPGVSHAARDWKEAMEWVRCYPDSDPDPVIYDIQCNRVRYVR